MIHSKKVVLFDGVCGLCDRSIKLLIWLDKKSLLKYTPIQGEFIKTLEIEPDIDSIIFYDEGTLYYKSTAILHILRSLGGIWVFTNVFYIIPKVVRDFIYDVIAKYRYKIFGKLESCRMLKEGEQELFLD